MTTQSKTPQSNEWRQFHTERASSNYPKWPNEAMLKVLFGSYLETPCTPQPDWKVLDVGCGFGNNLVPFADMGCESYGVEIDPEIAKLTSVLLEERGYKSNVVEGANRDIPFSDNMFDLVLSVNTLHYEGTKPNVMAALTSFHRVLKPGGILYMSTVGPEHEIFKCAKPLGNQRYQIQNYDFRDGQEFFFFENENNLERYCAEIFDAVETGQVTEKLMTLPCDFLITACRKA
jgi:SAM-dependent methyltransferase